MEMRKRFFTRGWSGPGTGSRVQEQFVQQHSQIYVLIFRYFYVELDSITLVGSFQPGISYDFMIVRTNTSCNGVGQDTKLKQISYFQIAIPAVTQQLKRACCPFRENKLPDRVLKTHRGLVTAMQQTWV